MPAGAGPARPTLSVVAGVVILALTGAGVLYLWQRQEPGSPGYRVVRAVEAFHLVEEEDVELAMAPVAQGDAAATSVIGRLATQPLKEGDVVLETELSPVTNDDVPRDAVIVGLPASSAQVLSGRLQAGARVKLAPLRDPTATTEAIVLAVVPSGSSAEPSYVMVVAIPDLARTQLADLSTGRYVLTASPSD